MAISIVSCLADACAVRCRCRRKCRHKLRHHRRYHHCQYRSNHSRAMASSRGTSSGRHSLHEVTDRIEETRTLVSSASAYRRLCDRAHCSQFGFCQGGLLKRCNILEQMIGGGHSTNYGFHLRKTSNILQRNLRHR